MKGAGAPQLASALLLARRSEDADASFPFATDDRMLARAARAEGLVVAW